MSASPITQGLSGTVFLTSAETGIILKSFGRNTSREMIWVYDNSVGYNIGFVGHNPEAAYTITGLQAGTTGVMAASPAVALTIANTSFGNGVGTSGSDNGGIYCLTTAIQHQEKNLREFTVTAQQHPGIA